MTTYTIAWGHSGTQGQEWTTAREASRYAAEEWGTVEAESAEEAIRVAQSEGLAVGDWYAVGEVIHVVPPEEEVTSTTAVTYRIYYHGAPYGPGQEGHVDYETPHARQAARKWAGIGPALRPERALVEVRDGEERPLILEMGSDWWSLQYADGGFLAHERGNLFGVRA